MIAAAALVIGCGNDGERGPEGREGRARTGARAPDTPPELAPPTEIPEPAPEDGEGFVRLDPPDPVVCGSLGTWTIEWTAGPSGLSPGGGVVLQISPFWGWSPPHGSAPGAPGFTTVSTSDPDAELRLADGLVPMTVVASLERGSIEPGERVTFVYGDTTAGKGGRARADMYAEAFEELLIKTDGNGDGVFGAPPDQPTLRILPGRADRLAVASPCVAAPGDTIVVCVHALDARENRTTLPPGRLLLVRAPLREDAATDPGAPDTVAILGRVTESDGERIRLPLERPGLFRLIAILEGSPPLRGANDLLLVEEGSTFTGVLWGDIHAHSALSDGTGHPKELYAYARDVAGLDVACVTDHDAHGLAPLAEDGWEIIRAATRAAHEPGRFVALLGYEWTSWTWGHRNVYYPDLEGEVFAFTEPNSDTPEALWDRIAPYAAMTIPHHPGGGPVPIDWSVPSDEERERVVEICSIHGSSEAPGLERGIYRSVPGAFVRDALNRGHRLGILASGDTHDGHPGRRTLGAPANGLVAFRARERTREAIWSALRGRRVYGTSGPRILLHTDWGGHAPGTELPAAPEAALTVRVVAPDPVEVIEVVGPEGPLETAFGGGRAVSCTFLAPPIDPRPAWIYVRVVLASGEVAWDSPYWTSGPGT
jgi:hypothetical protein